MGDPLDASRRVAGGAGARGGIASRYLAAIASSSPASSGAESHGVASQPPSPKPSDRRRRHHRQAFGSSPLRAVDQHQSAQPNLPALLSMGRRSAPPATSSTFCNAVSPKSTRTERTYPLDQSAGDDEEEGSSSWDEEQFSSPSHNAVKIEVVQHDESIGGDGSDELERGADGSDQQQQDSNVSPLSHPSDEPYRDEPRGAFTAMGKRRMSGDFRFEQLRQQQQQQQQLSTTHGGLVRQRSTNKDEKDPPPTTWGTGSGGFRIFMEARQLFAGCEGDRALDLAADEVDDNGDVKGADSSSTVPSSQHRRVPSDVKSDVTNASTQIATNRAIDVALRQRRLLAEHRKQEREGTAPQQFMHPLSSIHEQHSATFPSSRIPRGPLPMRSHPPRYSFGNHTHLNPAHLEAKSVLSVSSNDESSMSRTPQHPTVDAASVSRASGDESNDCPSRLVNDRLAQHVQSTAAARHTNPTPQSRGFSHVSVGEQSLSSSVGVEIDNKLVPNSHSTKQVKATFQNKTVMNHVLPNEAVEEGAKSTAPHARQNQNQGFVRMQTKKFAMGASNSQPNHPNAAAKLLSNKARSSEASACLSPPQIQRTTDSTDAIRHPSVSPDPIFCAQSESSPSHSAGSSSFLSSAAPATQPVHLSSGTTRLYSHVEDEEKEEKQNDDKSHRLGTRMDGNDVSRVSQITNLPAEVPSGPALRQIESNDDLRSSSFGDTKPAYPLRTASSLYWSRKTQSCTAVTVASAKAPQPSIPRTSRSTPLQGARTVSASCEQNPLLLPVLSNAFSQDSVSAHPAPKPRQALHFPGDIRERIPRSAPPPDSPVDAAPCSSFLEAIARFEKRPRKATPSQGAGHPILQDHAPLELRVALPGEDGEEEKTAFGKAVGSTASTRDYPDSQPMMQRRRRGIELVLGRNGRSTLTFEDEDGSNRHNDDDTASVKSLREKFEPPSPPAESEHSVRKMRALFEKPKRQFTTRREAVEGPLKEAISKFDAASLSSTQSRTKNSKPKPRSGNSRCLGVGNEEQDCRSLGQSTMSQRVHSTTIATSNEAPKIVAGTGASSSAKMSEDDDLSMLSKEYNNLVSSSTSFQEGRDLSARRNLPCTRPKSADPALSHPRIVPMRTNSSAVIASQRLRSTTRPEVISLVPTRRETPSPAPSAGPPSRRYIASDSGSQQVAAPCRNQDVQQGKAVSGGPLMSELAVSSFVQNVRQQTAHRSSPLGAALAQTSLSTRETLGNPPSTTQSDRLVNLMSARPAASQMTELVPGKRTSTPLSLHTHTSTPEPTVRKLVPSANGAGKSSGRHEMRSKSPALSTQQAPVVSFLGDNPNRIHTLERAHAALTKRGELSLLVNVDETSLRAPADGVVSRDVEAVNDTASLDAGVNRKEDSESDEDGSEFSDGVTLDLSIADVSNLTTPTALVSRADPCEAGTGSSDPGSKSADMAEAEAKRSEASSSQTSEAAAPLLARALGLYPRSDEYSANSFFAKRAMIANHWSKTSSLDLKSAGAEDERESKDDSFGGSGWDLSRIETSFPKTEPVRTDDSIFDFESDWQPFHANPPSISEIGGAHPSQGLFPRIDESLPSVMSRAKTPTRSNTSKLSMVRLPRTDASALRALPLNLQSSQRFDRSEAAPSFENSHVLAQPPAFREDNVQAESRAPLEAASRFPRTHPVANESSDDPYFWKRRAGVTLSSIRRRDSLNPQPPVRAIERLPVRLPPSSSSQHQAGRSRGPSESPLRGANSPTTPPPSSVVSSTTSTMLTERMGNQPYRHAAVMDRLRMLKESRLRRSSGYSPRSVELPDADETDQSTQSSTQFGGSTFLASLDVD